MSLAIFKNAGLPAVSSLSTTLRSLQKESLGVVFLKMDKSGHWVFGVDRDEVEAGSLWAINPFSFVHGYVAWGMGTALGEKTVAITEAKPDMGAAPIGAEKGWEYQMGVSLKCISGVDKDLDARFMTTSLGGKRALQEFAAEVANQIDKDPSKPVPVVILTSSDYMHKLYSRLYNPVFEIKKWTSMEGETEVVLPAPKRRRMAV